MRWPLWRIAVAERSMEPTLLPGDWLIAIRRSWAGRPIPVRPGQLVIARHPGRPELLVVKRAIRCEPGGWWLESDNPEAGPIDSRRFGIVPPELIEGRVLARYWPLRRSTAAGRR